VAADNVDPHRQQRFAALERRAADQAVHAGITAIKLGAGRGWRGRRAPNESNARQDDKSTDHARDDGERGAIVKRRRLALAGCLA